jgi:Carboxypeptidase regulatory-like domain
MPNPRSQLLAGLLFLGSFRPAQEPAPPQTQDSSPARSTQGTGSTSSGKKKGLPAYVILGTVFNEKALAYPNARVQIRREAEKKFHWETYTNSRGEFAVRVPEGQEYEVVVKEKKYKEASVKVSAKAGELQDRLSIRLEVANQEKGGEKK